MSIPFVPNGYRTPARSYSYGASGKQRAFLYPVQSNKPVVLLVMNSNGRNIVQPELVRPSTNATFTLAAISIPGGKTYHACKEMVTSPRYRPMVAHVLLAMGTNDMTEGFPVIESISARIEKLIRTAKKVYEESKVAIVSILPRHDEHRAVVPLVNEVLRVVASRNGVPFLNIIIPPVAWYWSDHVHLSDAGLRMYMDSLEREIEIRLLNNPDYLPTLTSAGPASSSASSGSRRLQNKRPGPATHTPSKRYLALGDVPSSLNLTWPNATSYRYVPESSSARLASSFHGTTAADALEGTSSQTFHVTQRESQTEQQRADPSRAIEERPNVLGTVNEYANAPLNNLQHQQDNSVRSECGATEKKLDRQMKNVQKVHSQRKTTNQRQSDQTSSGASYSEAQSSVQRLPPQSFEYQQPAQLGAGSWPYSTGMGASSVPTSQAAQKYDFSGISPSSMVPYNPWMDFMIFYKYFLNLLNPPIQSSLMYKNVVPRVEGQLRGGIQGSGIQHFEPSQHQQSSHGSFVPRNVNEVPGCSYLPSSQNIPPNPTDSSALTALYDFVQQVVMGGAARPNDIPATDENMRFLGNAAPGDGVSYTFPKPSPSSSSPKAPHQNPENSPIPFLSPLRADMESGAGDARDGMVFPKAAPSCSTPKAPLKKLEPKDSTAPVLSPLKEEKRHEGTAGDWSNYMLYPAPNPSDSSTEMPLSTEKRQESAAESGDISKGSQKRLRPRRRQISFYKPPGARKQQEGTAPHTDISFVEGENPTAAGPSRIPDPADSGPTSLSGSNPTSERDVTTSSLPVSTESESSGRLYPSLQSTVSRDHQQHMPSSESYPGVFHGPAGYRVRYTFLSFKK